MTNQSNMKAIWFYLLIPRLGFIMLTTAQQNVCPPWSFPDSRSATGCSCYHAEREEIHCTSNSTLLQFGYCMTYNSSNGLSEFGKCPYIAHYAATDIYILLPDNVSKLNEFMCSPLNREGTLCGKCKDGYGVAFYSYTLKCTKCWGHGYGWILYYFLELVPITVLYFLVVTFHIRATSSPLSAVVFLSQVAVYTIRLNVPLHMYIENKVTGFPYVVLQVLLVLCSIWSLDFFRFIIPPFCVSHNIRTIHALALEYLVAFYPIGLILITYACIKLHDNNFRPVVWFWKPFHRYFAYFRRRWDTKASIVNAFTTFLLLSFSKILFVSFTLLYSLDIQYNSEDIRKKCVLYYDPTVECYTQEHAIFAALAGCVLVVFVLLPIVLLILYPTRLFRKCVTCCGSRRWSALHIFVESFQGQYKDGTSGTHDFRMVSASFLVLRILIVAAFTRDRYYRGFILGIQCGFFICASCIHAITRPYKTTYQNNVDIAILGLLGLLLLLFSNMLYSPTVGSITHASVVTVLLLCVPHVALMFCVCYKLAEKTGVTLWLKLKYKDFKEWILSTRQTHRATENVDVTSDVESLPDRLINPEDYEPLLPNANNCTVGESPDSKVSILDEPRRLTPVYTYGSMN